MSPTDIYKLPACINTPQSGILSPCSETGSNPTCPDPTWAAECVPGQLADPQGETCACFAPQGLLGSCQLAIASRPATVPASGNVTVELTECTNCQNGVPEACRPYCASDADCQDIQQVCSSPNGGHCRAPGRLVNVQTTSDSTLVVEQDNVAAPFSGGKETFPFDVNITCDPYNGGDVTASPCDTITETVCSTVISGLCFTLQTSDQGTVELTCTEDEVSGAVSGNLTFSLAEGCGSGAKVQSGPAGLQYSFNGATPSETMTETGTFSGFCYASTGEVILNLNTDQCAANNLSGGFTLTDERGQ
jgi:hypothetical protein